MIEGVEVKMGIYRHWKGGLYQVLGLAHDANAESLVLHTHTGWCTEMPGDAPDERTVVVYMPLQLNAAHLGPRMAVRTLEDWLAWVHDDGSVCEHVVRAEGVWCHCDRTLPTQGFGQRFEYLGQVLTAEMLEAAHGGRSVAPSQTEGAGD
jgi:hypothetical protein